MKTDHTLPVPPELLNRACDTVCRSAGRIPFDKEGARVTRDLIAAAMEELNAEATRTLALSVRTSVDGKVLIDGLDRHLVHRGFSVPDSAGIADVLIESGIAGRASLPDRRSRRFLRAVRLNVPWTWTVAGESPGSVPFLPVAGGDDETTAWTSLCPVCRQGRLDPVTGEPLFGISPTDFLACTSCGAKFVPAGGTFRLVSIARRHDPAWLELLNMACTAAEWQQIARSGGIRKSDHRWCRGRREKGVNGARIQPVEQDSLALEIGDRTLYFTRIPVRFYKKAGDDCFRKRRDTLRNVLLQPAFAHIQGIVESRYGPYLDTPVGFFLGELKARRDPAYRWFLNAHGDDAFCSCRTEKSPLLSRRGVYVVASGQDVIAAGAAFRPFRETIDDLLGPIPPEACYLDGDPERCRINALLCSARVSCGLYVHALGEEREIARVMTVLSARILRTVAD